MALVAYPFRVINSSGTLVSGATVSIGSTTLSSNTSSSSPGATAVPDTAGVYLLATALAPTQTIYVTLFDYGTGDYCLYYDPTIYGEMYFPLTVTKTGSTFTSTGGLIPIYAYAEPSNAYVAATQASEAATFAQGITTTLAQGNVSVDSPTVAEIVTGLLNAITVTNTPTTVTSLGTYFVVTSTYSANLPNQADFIIQQNSKFPAFTASCYYQGTQIQIASATFRVWEAGNQLNNFVDAAMTVNSDYSVTYEWQTGDLPVAGTFQFQMIVTDLNGAVVPVPLTRNGIIVVTPEY